jgi:hypothetical protein
MATETQKPGSLRSAVLFAGLQQLIIIGLASVMLDGGVMLLKFLYAFVAYWVGFSILMIQRRKAHSKVDIQVVQYGYLLLCVISFVAAPVVWHLRGVNAW